MQESRRPIQGLDVHSEVNNVIKNYHMAEIPDWTALREIMPHVYDTLKYGRAPLDDILAVLESVTISLRYKVNQHMVDWDATDILAFGTKLASIEAYLDHAGNELIRHENPGRTVENLWAVVRLVREVWNELWGKGCITIERQR